MSSPLMKCGHVAQGVAQGTGKPVCVICIGIHPGAEQVEDEDKLPDLRGRMARCAYCGSERPSDLSLPFFEIGHYVRPTNGKAAQRTTEPPDAFYCGCRGWD